MTATKVVSAIRASVGIPPISEVDTYGDLPAAAAEGALRRVTTTGAAGVWQRVNVVDEFDVKMWFPEVIARRISGYAGSAGGAPFRISVGIGGDTVADLVARGFVDNSASGGTVTDIAGGIKFLSSATAWSIARLDFVVVAPGSPQLFFVLEGDSIVGGNTLRNTGFEYATGSQTVSLSLADGLGLENRLVFFGAASGGKVGAGYYDQTPYEQIFVLGSVPVGSAFCWPAATGALDYATGSEVGSAYAGAGDLYASASLGGTVICQKNTAGAPAELVIRELHAFKLV